MGSETVGYYGIFTQRTSRRMHRKSGQLHQGTARVFRFPRNAIVILHRLGKYIPKEHRKIIARFMGRTDRAIVVRKKNELRGTPYQLAENLTAPTERLLQRAQSVAGHKNTWTTDGNVIVRPRNGRIMAVEEDTPLEEFLHGSPGQRPRVPERTAAGRKQHRYFRGCGGGRQGV